MSEDETYIARRFLEGATYKQIAREMKVTRGSVAGKVHRLQGAGHITLKKRRGGGRQEPKPPPEPTPPPAPPSPAMLRLAEFDPVIARAAELRGLLAA